MLKELIKPPIKISGLKDLLLNYNHYFFDLDGVIWTGDHQIQGSIQTLNHLKQNNKKIYYITNNSTRNPEEVQQKFASFGYEADIKDIYCSPYITALYIKSRYPQISYIAAVGTNSMIGQLRKVGLKVLHLDKMQEKIDFKDLIQQHLDEKVQALVVGYDRNFNYTKICLLSLYIQRGIKFLGTNPDKATRLHGYRMPGCGSMIACLQAASGKLAQVVGKPNPFILDYIINKQNIKKQECIMVGDNLQTDIVFGSKIGIDTLCTMSGVSNEQLILNNNIITPTYYSQRIGSKLN